MREEVQTSRMRERLRQLYADDEEERVSKNIRRLIEDPLRPRIGTERVRINRILLMLAALAAIAIGAFLYFSFGSV